MTPEEHSQQQWSAIVALLTAELGTGRLPTVLNVHPSVDLWSGATPAIGVQLAKVRADLTFTKKMKSVADFIILASVQSQPVTISSGVIPPNLDDSNARLQPIIADGNGNGIANILRDPANRTLSGLAALMLVTGMEYSWEIGRGAAGSSEVWSHALVSVTVEDFISIA